MLIAGVMSNLVLALLVHLKNKSQDKEIGFLKTQQQECHEERTDLLRLLSLEMPADSDGVFKAKLADHGSGKKKLTVGDTAKHILARQRAKLLGGEM